MRRPSRFVTAAALLVGLALCAASASPQVRLRLHLFQYGLTQGGADSRRGWNVSDGATFWMMVPPRDEVTQPADALHPPTVPDTPEWRLIRAVWAAPAASQRGDVEVFLAGYRMGRDWPLWGPVIAATTTAAAVGVALILAIRRRGRPAGVASPRASASGKYGPG